MPIRKISGITSSLVTIAEIRGGAAFTKATVTQNNLLAKAQTNITINKAATQQSRLVSAVQADAEGLIRQYREYQYMRDRMGLLINKVFADDFTMLDLVGVADGAVFDFDLLESEVVNILESLTRVTQIYREFADTPVMISRPSLEPQIPRADDFFITDVSQVVPNKQTLEQVFATEAERHIVDFRRVYAEYPAILDQFVRSTVTQRATQDAFNLSDDSTLGIGIDIFNLLQLADQTRRSVQKSLTDAAAIQSRYSLTFAKFLTDEFGVPDLIGVYDGATFDFDAYEYESVIVTVDATLDIVQRKFDVVQTIENIALTKTVIRAGDGFTDQVNIGDASVKTVGLQGRLFDFAVAAQDADPVRDIGLNKFETLSLPETLAKYIAAQKANVVPVLDRPSLNYALATIFEGIDVTDEVITTLLAYFEFLETVLVSDADPVFDVFKLLGETAIVTEEFAALVDFVRQGTGFEHNAQVTDDKQLNVGQFKFETLSALDFKTLAVASLKQNSVLMSDLFEGVADFVRKFSETTSIADPKQLAVAKPLTDDFTLLDTILVLLIVFQSVADFFALTDDQSFAIGKGQRDSIAEPDVFTRSANYLRAGAGFSHIAGQTDDQILLTNLGKFDSVAPLDQRAKLSIGKKRTDVQSTADRVSKSLIRPRTDSLSVLDRKSLRMDPTQFDVVTFSDFIERLPVKNRFATETLLITDRRPALQVFKNLRDAFGLIDLAGVFDGLNFQYNYVKLETLLISDVFIKRFGKPNLAETVYVGANRYLYNENRFPNSENFVVAPAWTASGTEISVPNSEANFILNSEQIFTTPWTFVTSGGTVASTSNTNRSTDPNGTNTAEEITVSSGTTTYTIEQTLTNLTTGQTYLFSVYLRSNASRTVTLQAKTGTSAGTVSVSAGRTAGTAWGRHSLSISVTTSTMTVGITGSLSAGSVFLWGAQVNIGAITSNYVRTTSAAINGTAAPDGTFTTTRLTETATLSGHQMNFPSLGPITNRAQTFSIYAKASESKKVWLQLSNFSNSAVQALFNLTSGTVEASPSSTADFINAAAFISDAGNGWFRLTITARKQNANTSSIPVVWLDNGNGLNPYQGNLNNGAYVWGAQISATSEAQPYLKTTGSVITATKLRGDDNESLVYTIGKNPREILVSTDRDVFAITSQKFETLLATDRKFLFYAKPRTEAIVTGRSDFAAYTSSTSNSFLFSEELQRATAWTTSNATISSNAALAPNKTTTAERLIENTANAVHGIQSVSSLLISGTTANVSIYAKADTANRFLRFVGANIASVLQAPVFDLTNGTVSVSSGTSVVKSATIQDVGDGWYRCSAVVLPGTTGAMLFNLSNTTTPGPNVGYTGTAGSGLYLWGAQITTGAALRVYVRTTTAAISSVTIYADGKTERAVSSDYENVSLTVRKPMVETSVLSDSQIFEYFASRTLPEALIIADSIYAVPGKTRAPAETLLIGEVHGYQLATPRSDEAVITDAERYLLGKLIGTANSYTNLLLRSEEMTTAPWSASTNAGTFTANALASPAGTTTAERFENTGTTTANPIVQQTVTGLRTGVPYNFSVYLLGQTGATPQNISVFAKTGTSAGAITVSSLSTLTTSWVRYDLPVVATSSIMTLGFTGIAIASATGSDTLWFWGAQLTERSLRTYLATTGVTRTALMDGNQNVVIQDAERWFYSKPRNNSIQVQDVKPRLLPTLGKFETLLTSDQITGKNVTLRIPRFSYSSTLVQNLYLYSEEINNAAWIKSSNASININNSGTVAPDGTTTADSLESGSNTTNEISIYQSFTTVTSVTGTAFYVHSVYGKTKDYRFIQLAPNTNFSTAAWANFDLTANTYSLQGTVTTQTAGIENIGNGWRRCWIRVPATVAAAGADCIMLIVNSLTAARRATFTVARNRGVYLWGAQVGADVLAPYVRTTSTTYTQTMVVATPINSTTVVDDVDLRNTRVTRRFDDDVAPLEASRLLIGKRFIGQDSVSVTDARTLRSIVLGKFETAITGDANRYSYFKPIPNSAPIQNTNQLIRSEELQTATVWVTNNATVVANVSSAATLAPDGTATAEKLNENTTNATHDLRYGVLGAGTSNITQTFSIYAKAAQRSRILLQLNNLVGNYAGAIFDVSSGTIVSTTSLGEYSQTSANIVNAGSGWYRISLSTFKGTTTSVSSVPAITLVSGAATITYAGVATNGIYLWGASLSRDRRTHDYIRTTSATRTLAGDTVEQQVTVTDRPVIGRFYRTTDSFLLADAKSNRPGKGLRDTQALADQLTRRDIGKRLLRTVTIADQTRTQLNNRRSVSLLLTTADANRKRVTKLLRDSFLLPENIAKSTAQRETDALSIADREGWLFNKPVPNSTPIYHTNLLIRSEELQTAGVWGTSNATVVANVSSAATLAPDGTATAEKFNENTTAAEHRLTYNVLGPAGSGITQTFSIFAKPAQRTRIVLQLSNQINNTAQTVFDISSGAVVLQTTTGEYSNLSSVITSAGNGWYRCSVTAFKGATTSISSVPTVIMVSGATTLSYAGVATNGVYLWGASLSRDRRIHEYVQTTSATRTILSDTFEQQVTLLDVVQVALLGGFSQRVADIVLTLDLKRLLITKLNADQATVADKAVLISGLAKDDQLQTSERNFNTFVKPVPNSAVLRNSNYLRFSEQLQTAGTWGTSNATVVANVSSAATLAPDGTATAEKLNENTTNAQHFLIYNALGAVSSAQQTFSIYAKAAQRNVIYLQLANQTTGTATAFFNLSSGTVLSTSEVNPPYSNTVAKIFNVGSGWYRCSITTNKSSFGNASSAPVVGLVSGTATASYAGVATNGVYLWGASLSYDRQVNTYIQTTANAIVNIIGDTFEQQVSVNDDYNKVLVARRAIVETPTILDFKRFAITKPRTEDQTIEDRPFKLIGKTAPYSEYFSGENLYIRSEDLGNAAWVTSHSSISIAPNVTATTDPVGTNTAEKFYENNTGNNSARNYYQLHSVVTGQFYVHSVYAKAAERTFLQIAGAASYSSNAWANFDLTNVAYSLQGTVTTETAGIEDVGNGWRRCWIRIVATSTNATAQVRYGIVTALNASRLPNVSSVSGNGIYIWGNQLNNNVLGSYTQTTGNAIAFYEYFNLLNFVAPADSKTQEAVGKGRFETIITADTDRLAAAKRLQDVPLLLDDSSQAADLRRTLSPDSITIGNQNPPVGTNRQNFFLYSEDFANTYWNTSNNVTVSSNVTSTTAPDGTNTADRMVESTAAGVHYLNSTSASVQVRPNITYNISVYAKFSTTSRFIQFGGHGLNTVLQVPVFDVGRGLVYVSSGTSVLKSASIEAVGNGWYRCSAVIVPNLTSTTVIGLSNTTSTATLANYTGVANSGVFIWGAQITTGTTLQAYTRTTSSTIYQVIDSPETNSAQETHALLINKSRTEQVTQADQNRKAMVLGRPADINIVSSQGTTVYVSGTYYALEDYFAETYGTGTRSTQTFN